MKRLSRFTSPCIYFIEYNDNIIKIGCTTDLASRLFELTFDMRLVSMYPINVLGYIEVDKSEMYDVERTLHERFVSTRIKPRKTDFFRSDERILAYIKEHCNRDCESFNRILQERRLAGHPKLAQLKQVMAEHGYKEDGFYL